MVFLFLFMPSSLVFPSESRCSDGRLSVCMEYSERKIRRIICISADGILLLRMKGMPCDVCKVHPSIYTL